MSRQVTHLKCLVISPGDVKPERAAVGRAIDRFNAHTGNDLGVIVEKVSWEIHSYPDLSGPPQEKINEQMVDACDFGIAIFWSRVGTPTTLHLSGSVEEIELLLARGKKVSVYFCDRNVPLDGQIEQIKQLRAAYLQRGLVATFQSVEELEILVMSALSGLVPKLLQEPSQQLPTPDIRVRAAFGKVVEAESPGTAYPALRVSVENHSARPLFLANIALEGEGCRAGPFINPYRQQIQDERTIEPGDGLQAIIRMTGIKQFDWREFVAVDKIGRRFVADTAKFRVDFANWREWLKENPPSDWREFRGREGCYFQETKLQEKPGLSEAAVPLASDMMKPAIPTETASLSPEANAYLDVLSEAYVKAGFPNYKVWKFDKGKESALHNELRAHGVIELMGAKGASWRLTDRGHELLLARGNDPSNLPPTTDSRALPGASAPVTPGVPAAAPK